MNLTSTISFQPLTFHIPVLELLCYVLQLLKELQRGFPVRTLVVLDVLDEQVEGADVDAIDGGLVQPIVEYVLRYSNVTIVKL